MKKILSAVIVAGGLAVLSGAALGQWGGGPGPGYGRMGPGMMWGSGPGWRSGNLPCANLPGAATEITEEKAKELAAAYADRYLKGFKVDKVLPFTGRFHTMYSVELKNDAGEVRTLHINPYGNVMPFGGPWSRAS